MLWLDTSWVLDLTNIFRSYILLFSVIFPHWHHYYHFSLDHISSLVTFIVFSFPSSLPTWHYLCFTLSSGFSHYCMKDSHIRSLFHFMGISSKILIWDVVLLWGFMLHHITRRVYLDGLCIIIEDCLLLIKTCTKKKKKTALFICSFFILHSSLSMCMDVSIWFIVFMC